MEISEADEKLLSANKGHLGQLSKLQRITLLGDAIEALKSRPYEDRRYISTPRFSAGDEVVVLSQFYYFATVRRVTPWYCPELRRTIPAYNVIYRDWNKPEPGREEVAEYDIIGLAKPHYRPIELFMAYHWNRLHGYNRLSHQQRSGMFYMDKDGIEKIESEVNRKFTDGFDINTIANFKDWLYC